VPDGGLDVPPEIAPKPRDTVAPDDVVGVDDALQALAGGDVPAHDNRCAGEVLADHLAHFFHLARVGDDGTDPDDVVVMVRNLARELFERRVVEDGAGGVDVGLQHPQREGRVEHAQREAPLEARHLVLVELHGIDAAASVLVVLRVGAEYACEQDAGPMTLRVCGMRWLHGVPFNGGITAILHIPAGEGKLESGFYNSFTVRGFRQNDLPVDREGAPLYGSGAGHDRAPPGARA